MTSDFESLKGTKTILLTTFRRHGAPVATPVSVAFDHDRAFFRSFLDATFIAVRHDGPKERRRAVKERLTGPRAALARPAERSPTGCNSIFTGVPRSVGFMPRSGGRT